MFERVLVEVEVVEDKGEDNKVDQLAGVVVGLCLFGWVFVHYLSITWSIKVVWNNGK